MNLKTSILKFLTFCLFSFALSAIAEAQSGVYISTEEEKETAETLLENLSEGVLIVRLNSDKRKMEELERLANSPNLSEKSRQRFDKMLKKTSEDNLEENRNIMQAVGLNYDFSEVLFMHDTATSLLQSGVKSGYFLDENLEVDESKKLDSDRWMLLYFDRLSSPMLFKILDRNFNEVEKPFPVFSKPGLRRYTFKTPDGVQRKFSPFMSYGKKNQLWYFSMMISSWNGRLKKFRKKAGED